MALRAIDAICRKCGTRFQGIPKRTPLGFHKLKCPSCSEKVIYPLAPAYVVIWYLLLVYMVYRLVVIVNLGEIPIPGLLGIATIIALVRDRKIEKEVAKAEIVFRKSASERIDHVAPSAPPTGAKPTEVAKQEATASPAKSLDMSNLPTYLKRAFREGWNLDQNPYSPNSSLDQAHILGKFARENKLTGTVTKGGEFNWTIGDQSYRIEQRRVVKVKAAETEAEEAVAPAAVAVEALPEAPPIPPVTEAPVRPPAVEGLRRTGAPTMPMNKKQRCVLLVCAAIIVLMLLFPPFHHHSRYGQIINMGYVFLFSDHTHNGEQVDTGTLLAQWAGVILVGGILWLAFRDREKGS